MKYFAYAAGMYLAVISTVMADDPCTPGFNCPVPEPDSFALFGIGAAALLFARLRKK